MQNPTPNQKRMALDVEENPKKISEWILFALQHVLAMLVACITVPLLTGLPVAATIVSAGSNAHALQQSRVAAIHGNPWRPVVVTEPSAFGQRLTFYTSQGGNRAALTEALYLPLPRVETDIHGCEVARLPRLLYDDIVLSTAQRTLDILRQ